MKLFQEQFFKCSHRLTVRQVSDGNDGGPVLCFPGRLGFHKQTITRGHEEIKKRRQCIRDGETNRQAAQAYRTIDYQVQTDAQINGCCRRCVPFIFDMANLTELCSGLPLDPLPQLKDRDPYIPHAPVRACKLNQDEKKVHVFYDYVKL